MVEYAHDHGVVVEGELGRLAGVEDDVKVGDDDALYTDPERGRGICEGDRRVTLWPSPSAPATARIKFKGEAASAL